MIVPVRSVERMHERAKQQDGVRENAPSAPQSLDDCAFLVGHHIGFDVNNAKPTGNGLGRDPVVAGQHDDPDSGAGQVFQGVRRG